MGWFQNIANTISAFWTGNLCQSRIDEDKNVVVQKEPPQTIPPVDNSEKSSENNQSSNSQTVFAPELMMHSSSFPARSVDHIFSKTYKQTDKLELCKRILNDNFSSDDESKKEEFIKKLNQFLKINTGVCGKLKLQNGDGAKNISNIASQLNGLQKINDEELKERIDIILENLDNKEAFNHYMGFYPKTSSNSRESSPGMDSSRESSPGILPRGPYSPAGSMSPANSRGGKFFTRPPSNLLHIG